MSEYIGSYLEGPDVLHCPNTPNRYTYLEDAWKAGDRWDHPFTPLPHDPLVGTYNTLWNYTGYLPEFNRPFSGPRGPSDSRGFSRLVSIDYFGFDHWSAPNAFSSCEKITHSMEKPETWVAASCWTTSPLDDPAVISVPDVSLTASFTDGHVENFDSSESTILQVAITQDGTVPYPAGAGAGNIYIPRSALK